jgi:hypothetical protein
MKITKITYYNLPIPGKRGSLSKKCKDRANNPSYSDVMVGSCTCALCPLFLARIGQFIICKGKRNDKRRNDGSSGLPGDENGLTKREPKPFPCRKCIKGSLRYDFIARTSHLFCIEHQGWCQYAAKTCKPLPEWKKRQAPGNLGNREGVCKSES